MIYGLTRKKNSPFTINNSYVFLKFLLIDECTRKPIATYHIIPSNNVQYYSMFVNKNTVFKRFLLLLRGIREIQVFAPIQ